MSEGYRTWRRYYNMARHPVYEGHVGLSVRRSEHFADALYHADVNGLDLAPLFDQLNAELRAKP